MYLAFCGYHFKVTIKNQNWSYYHLKILTHLTENLLWTNYMAITLMEVKDAANKCAMAIAHVSLTAQLKMETYHSCRNESICSMNLFVSRC